MTPRERRLLAAAGILAVVGLFAFIGWQIKTGLADLEARNARAREALALLEKHREDIAAGKVQAASDGAAEAPVALATYLERIANELGINLPETTESTKPTKNAKYQEHTIDVTLRNITIDQLAQFLKRVETDQPGVVTSHLNVRPYRSDHARMDVELTIAAYEKVKGKGGEKEKGKGKDAGEGEGPEKEG